MRCPNGITGRSPTNGLETNNMAKTLKQLQAAAKELENNLPFMEGRVKGEMTDLVGKTITIIEYGFLDDGKNNKEYACFVTAEDKEHFYFAGQVLTDGLQSFEQEGYHDVIVAEGLPVAIGKKTSANKREYITAKFFPEEKF